METRLIDELMAIPADATTATIQGVEMQIISTEQADKMLDADSSGEKTHECILKNGRFLFESENEDSSYNRKKRQYKSTLIVTKCFYIV